MTQPFTWIVRLDVAPEWVADGFALSDQRALAMLGKDLDCACPDTELAASVLVAPNAERIAREQGYGPVHPHTAGVIASLLAGAPRAQTGDAVIEGALVDAIKLLDSVAFVSHENDNTGGVLSKLRDALALVQGTEPISTIRG